MKSLERGRKMQIHTMRCLKNILSAPCRRSLTASFGLVSLEGFYWSWKRPSPPRGRTNFFVVTAPRLIAICKMMCSFI
jgi:hypothetical protein